MKISLDEIRIERFDAFDASKSSTSQRVDFPHNLVTDRRTNWRTNWIKLEPFARESAEESVRESVRERQTATNDSTGPVSPVSPDNEPDRSLATL